MKNAAVFFLHLKFKWSRYLHINWMEKMRKKKRRIVGARRQWPFWIVVVAGSLLVFFSFRFVDCDQPQQQQQQPWQQQLPTPNNVTATIFVIRIYAPSYVSGVYRHMSYSLVEIINDTGEAHKLNSFRVSLSLTPSLPHALPLSLSLFSGPSIFLFRCLYIYGLI